MRRAGKILGLAVGLGLVSSAWAQSPVLLYQNSINSNILPQGRGGVTAQVLNQVLNTGASIFQTMGTWDANGNYIPNIPATTPGLVTSVPQRVATGSTDTTTSSDFLVCLNGPTVENLEPNPTPGTTHVFKDCRSGSGNPPIQIIPQGGLTIDRGASYSLTSPAQAINVTFTPLGWSIY